MMNNRIKLKHFVFVLFFAVALFSAEFAYAAFYDDSSRYIPVSRRSTEDLYGEFRSFYLDKTSIKVMSTTLNGAILDLDSIYVSSAWQPFGAGAAIYHARYLFDKGSRRCWFVYMSADLVDENREILIDEDGETCQDISFDMKGEVYEALPRAPSGLIGNIAYEIAFNQRFR